MATTATTVCSDRRCPMCGRDLAPGAPDGLCPRCLLRAGLEQPDPTPGQSNAQPQDLLRTRFFGDYELVREIGHGGMGVVYQARQLGTQRTVALKFLSGGALASRDAVHRFHTEAHAAALLEHPGIVPIYEAGMHDGQYFLAMRFIGGGSLAELAKLGPLPPRRTAEIMVVIAAAVQFAHARGVLHRDLKPDNILLDDAGAPLVSDFGLARLLESDDRLTFSSAFLGTAAYMAPEQTMGGGAPTIASDIYGLGAILYELLAGKPPFQQANLGATLRALQEEEPVPPSERLDNPRDIPRDLETICLKCLQKEPAKRYSTAQSVADDLNRFLSDEPILARPAGPTERVWRWCQRKPITAGLVAALNLAIALGLSGVLWEWRRAVAGERNALQHQYVSDMNLAKQVWEEGNVSRARDLLRAHVPKPDQSDLRGFEWRYLWTLCQQDDSSYVFTNFDDGVRDLAYSPDKHLLAAAAGHSIKLLDVASRSEAFELTDTDTSSVITRVAWSPANSNLLATGGSDGTIKFWNIATKQSRIFGYHLSARDPEAGDQPSKPSEISDLAFSFDGQKLIVSSGQSSFALRVWDTRSKSEIWSTNLVKIPPGAAALAPDGKTLITGGGDAGNARVWDAATGQELAPFPVLHTGWIGRIAISPDGRAVATAANDNRLIIWDFPERRPRVPPLPNPGWPAFSPDGRLLGSGGADGLVRVWKVNSGEQLRLLRGHVGPVLTLAFTPDGTELVSGGSDRTVRLWKLTPQVEKDLMILTNRCINSLTFSPDGKRLATGSVHRNWTEVWDVPARQWITNLYGHIGDVRNATFSPDGKILATAGYDKAILLWNAQTFGLQGVLSNGFAAGRISFSPDSKVLAAARFTAIPSTGRLDALAFWDLATRHKIEKLSEAAPNASCVAFSNGGGLVAISYADGWVRLWDFRNERKLGEFRKTGGTIWQVTFSPDDHLLASTAGANVVLYDVVARRVLRTLAAHTGRTLFVRFAPDGKTLASAGDDGTVRLWNLATDDVALILTRKLEPVYSLAFSRDGTLLATGGLDGDVQLWPALPFEQINTDTDSDRNRYEKQ